jgi:hydroxymethylglutaryl-CoA lyase
MLQAGFDTVEVGSFVSPAAIPQMRDTAEVLDRIDVTGSVSKIMVLVAGKKGMDQAASYDIITDICYPFSASASFLKMNINRSTEESLADIDHMLETCNRSGKNLNVYITMAYGNPYNDAWSLQKVVDLAGVLSGKGVRCIPLSDITGEADEQRMSEVFQALHNTFPEIEFGLHLHAERHRALSLVEAAWNAGCRRYDTVTGGMGGCPMTGKELLANLDTLELCKWLDDAGMHHDISTVQLSGLLIE